MSIHTRPLSNIEGWDVTMALGGTTGYLHQAILYHPWFSSSTSLNSSQTLLLLFLAYLFTTYLQIVLAIIGEKGLGIFIPVLSLNILHAGIWTEQINQLNSSLTWKLIVSQLVFLPTQLRSIRCTLLPYVLDSTKKGKHQIWVFTKCTVFTKQMSSLFKFWTSDHSLLLSPQWSLPGNSSFFPFWSALEAILCFTWLLHHVFLLRYPFCQCNG